MINLMEEYNGLSVGYYGAATSFSGTSEPIRMKPTLTQISVGAYPSPGQTVRVEATISGQDLIDAGTAKWIPWASGDVSQNVSDAMLTQAYAIRGVGIGSIEVLAR